MLTESFAVHPDSLRSTSFITFLFDSLYSWEWNVANRIEPQIVVLQLKAIDWRHMYTGTLCTCNIFILKTWFVKQISTSIKLILSVRSKSIILSWFLITINKNWKQLQYWKESSTEESTSLNYFSTLKLFLKVCPYFIKHYNFYKMTDWVIFGTWEDIEELFRCFVQRAHTTSDTIGSKLEMPKTFKDQLRFWKQKRLVSTIEFDKLINFVFKSFNVRVH